MTTLLTTGAAAAETRLNPVQLDGLLTSQTVYLDTPVGEALIYFRADAASFARLPNGVQMQGTWALTEDGYCVDWVNGPQNSCTQVVRSADALHMVDSATGDPRGQVSRIVPGNPEGF
ncbi:MAG: hypothetical protein AAF376_16580 [Pseudomonadota bacterium]